MSRRSVSWIVVCIAAGTAIGGGLLYLWPKSETSPTQQAITQILNGHPEQGKETLEAMLADGVPNAEAEYWVGVAYQRSGDWQKAIDSFTKAMAIDREIAQSGVAGQEVRLQRDPSEVLVRRGTCHLELKQYDAAIADLTGALQTNDYNAAAYCKRGTAYLRDGFPELARADLSEALLLDSRYVEALLLHGHVSLELSDPGRALRDAQTAVRNQVDCPEGYEIMARSYLATGDYLKATNCARKLAPDKAKQIAQLIQEAEKAAASKSLLAANEATGPRVVLKPTVDRPNDAQVHFDEGIAQMNAEKWDKAVDQFTESLNLFQNDPEAYYQRGRALLEEGFPDTAIKDFNQAQYLQPGFAPAVRERAHAWLELGDPLAAVDDSSRAIGLEPDDAASHLIRARAYLKIRQFTRALADLEEAEKLHPELADEARPLAAEAYADRAVESLHARRWDEALGDFQEALRLEPSKAQEVNALLAEAYRGRAVQRRANGQTDTALADLDQAIRLEPNAADNYRLAGETYLKVGDWEKAIARFDRAAELAPQRAFRVEPGLAEAHYRRGQAYELAGQTAQAEADFARAKQLGWKTL